MKNLNTPEIEIGARVRDRDGCDPECGCNPRCSVYHTEGIVVGEIYWGSERYPGSPVSEHKTKPYRVLFIADDEGEVHEIHATDVEKV